MTPVIRIDDQVMDELKKRAVEFGLVFNTPNEVLRVLLGLHKQDNIITDKKYVDIEIRNPHSSQKYHFIPIPKRIRRFLPGYKLPFSLETDIGEIKTYVSSAPNGTHMGDPDKGAYIQSRLKKWFDTHQIELKNGATLRIQALEAGRRYKLSLNK
ncbi:MAG: hypothetical protein U1D67_09130 [Dehalococcoidia bacterium]|nr:hypothetical protein [Dehalococcoidales bacterium]MDZ4247266.1 hypothetical protein [Dehalococcoidia bacterium]